MKKIRIFWLILSVVAMAAFFTACSNPAAPSGSGNTQDYPENPGTGGDNGDNGGNQGGDDNGDGDNGGGYEPDPNFPPAADQNTINTINAILRNGLVSQQYDATLEAAAYPLPAFVITGDLPPGLSQSGTRGEIISGIPTLAGNFPFELTISNSEGSITLNVSITIDSDAVDAVANAITLTSALRGVSMSYQLTTADGTGPFTWARANGSGNLPGGLNLNSATGVIYGTPTNTGVFPFSVTVTGYTGVTSDPVGTTVTIAEPVTISPVSLPGAVVGSTYNQTISITGDTPVTVNVSGLPMGGLSWNAGTRTISGTPTTAGNITFTISALTQWDSDEREFTINVVAPPVITTGTALPAVQVGIPNVERQLAATGCAPIIWSLISGNLPNGLTLNNNTGLISGTPSAAGTFTFTIAAQNAAGADHRSERQFTMVIEPVPTLSGTISLDIVMDPVANGTASATPRVGDTITAAFTADPDQGILGTATWTWFRGADTTPVGSGATRTVTLQDYQAGAQLRAVLTCSIREGEVSQTFNVGRHPITGSAAFNRTAEFPAIAGTQPRVGDSLAANFPGLNSNAAQNLTWLRGSTPISVTGGSHSLTVADYGQTITARVSVADRSGSLEVISAAVERYAITGALQVGWVSPGDVAEVGRLLVIDSFTADNTQAGTRQVGWQRLRGGNWETITDDASNPLRDAFFNLTFGDVGLHVRAIITDSRRSGYISSAQVGPIVEPLAPSFTDPAFPPSTPGNGSWFSGGSGADQNGIRDIAFARIGGVNRFVAVGGGGAIATSDDYGATWTQRTSGTTNQLRDIAVHISSTGATRFVAVGDSNTRRWSNDGITWHGGSGGTGSGNLHGVAVDSNGVFVAVGANGRVLRSTDGETWTGGGNIGHTAGLWDIAYGDGNFVVVADGTNAANQIRVSSDGGVTWSGPSPNPASGAMRDVTFGNGYFIAVGDSGRMLRSTRNDPRGAWTTINAGTANYAQSQFTSSQMIRSNAFGEGRFLSVGDAGNISFSDDLGRTWTRVAGGTANGHNLTPAQAGDSGMGNNNVRTIIYVSFPEQGFGIFIAAGAHGRVVRSKVGIEELPSGWIPPAGL